MRIPDREMPFTVTQEGKQLAQIMQPPAAIDLALAKQVADAVEKRKRPSHSLALNHAWKLATYNFQLFHPQATTREWDLFGYSLKRLGEIENEAADLANPLPPIGWEVENHSLAFRNLKSMDPNDSHYMYRSFFGALGIPNIFNALNDQTTQVEIASYPAYSAAVASRLLAEFIKCGIIPSLRKSQEPNDIKAYLGSKLVSLHVSLGIPPHIHHKDPRYQKTLDKPTLLSSSMALAFTSPLRMVNKSSQTLHSWKLGQGDMVDTTKTSIGVGRLELKALEVRDESVYRVMDYAQLMGAAFFASYDKRHPKLADEWKIFEKQLVALYQRFGFTSSKLHSSIETRKLFSLQVTPQTFNELGIPHPHFNPQKPDLKLKAVPFSLAVRKILDDSVLRIRPHIPKAPQAPLVA